MGHCGKLRRDRLLRRGLLIGRRATIPSPTKKGFYIVYVDDEVEVISEEYVGEYCVSLLNLILSTRQSPNNTSTTLNTTFSMSYSEECAQKYQLRVQQKTDAYKYYMQQKMHNRAKLPTQGSPKQFSRAGE